MPRRRPSPPQLLLAPYRATIRSVCHVDRTPADIWAFLISPASEVALGETAMSCELLPATRNHGELRVVTHELPGGQRLVGVIEVLETRPPSRAVYRTASLAQRNETTVTLELMGDGTTCVTHTQWIEFPVGAVVDQVRVIGVELHAGAERTAEHLPRRLGRPQPR